MERASACSRALDAAWALGLGAAMGVAGTLLYYRYTAPRCRLLEEKAAGSHACMLISEDGTKLLKPLDQGTVEIDNYVALMRTPLRPFLVGFHGVRSVSGESHRYMVLDSAYAGLQPPYATLDIKLGKKTWEDNASPQKIAKESKKFDEVYSKSSAKDGFRVAGMKAGDLVLTTDNLKHRHSLLTNEFGEWLLPAFFADHPGYGPLPEGTAGERRPPAPPGALQADLASAREILGQLKALSAAAELGFGGNLRAASFLITREMRKGGSWCAKLIDLMHYTQTGEERDHNFCDGVQNLIRIWEAWLAAAGRAV